MLDTNTNVLLKSVQDLYTKGDYDQAIDVLIKAKEQLEPGLFHFNLGTLYLKVDRLGAARYNLEKSKKLGFYDAVVKNNIDVIRQNSELTDISNTESLWEGFLYKTIDLPPYVLGSGLIFMTLFFFVLFRLKKINMTVLASLVVLFVLIPASFKFYVSTYYQDVVAMKDTPIHEGPSKVFEENGSLGEGSRVIVVKEHNDWFYVGYPSYSTGWVKRSSLGFY